MQQYTVDRKQKKMFFLERGIIIVLGVFLPLPIPFIYSDRYHFIVFIVLEVVMVRAALYICKETLLLPIDLYNGAVVEEVYFDSVLHVWNHMLLGNSYYRELEFHREDKVLHLIIPEKVYSLDELSLKPVPPNNKKIRIVYYKRSRILLGWELLRSELE